MTKEKELPIPHEILKRKRENEILKNKRQKTDEIIRKRKARKRKTKTPEELIKIIGQYCENPNSMVEAIKCRREKEIREQLRLGDIRAEYKTMLKSDIADMPYEKGNAPGAVGQTALAFCLELESKCHVVAKGVTNTHELSEDVGAWTHAALSDKLEKDALHRQAVQGTQKPPLFKVDEKARSLYAIEKGWLGDPNSSMSKIRSEIDCYNRNLSSNSDKINVFSDSYSALTTTTKHHIIESENGLQQMWAKFQGRMRGAVSLYSEHPEKVDGHPWLHASLILFARYICDFDKFFGTDDSIHATTKVAWNPGNLITGPAPHCRERHDGTKANPSFDRTISPAIDILDLSLQDYNNSSKDVKSMINNLEVELLGKQISIRRGDKREELIQCIRWLVKILQVSDQALSDAHEIDEYFANFWLCWINLLWSGFWVGSYARGKSNDNLHKPVLQVGRPKIIGQSYNTIGIAKKYAEAFNSN
ncbi:hypothetical protein [Candidatus Sneabacter namystus]|uniref:Uncharacterized protein n=1 Tax=Candidatus Sneabacter namystus TaxID=2601646 RepID=A0A5C0UI04_9RICK|nr:hypothetical protein [Candidatus Sneabacter namystus]QEK39397.1 hypothetical protein FZC37_00365 [Candidatus Sneabacter namystus]